MTTITLYFAPGCPHCAAARAWLNGRGLEFAEVDVRTHGPSLHQALVHAGQPAVPVIEVGTEVLIGFDEQRLEELLRRASTLDS